jgi:hypothetical protein
MGAGDAPRSDSVGSAPADHRAFRLGAWTDAGCAGGPRPGSSPDYAVGAAADPARALRARAALRCGRVGLRAPHPTRLETRTKESDMRASRRVLKPGRRKEADERVITAGRPRSSVKGSSWSMPVGTRKMVNYA